MSPAVSPHSFKLLLITIIIVKPNKIWKERKWNFPLPSFEPPPSLRLLTLFLQYLNCSLAKPHLLPIKKKPIRSKWLFYIDAILQCHQIIPIRYDLLSSNKGSTCILRDVILPHSRVHEIHNSIPTLPLFVQQKQQHYAYWPAYPGHISYQFPNTNNVAIFLCEILFGTRVVAWVQLLNSPLDSESHQRSVQCGVDKSRTKALREQRAQNEALHRYCCDWENVNNSKNNNNNDKEVTK